MVIDTATFDTTPDRSNLGKLNFGLIDGRGQQRENLAFEVNGCSQL